MRSVILLSICILGWLLALSVCHSKNIRIVTIEFRPYAYTADGEIKGFSVDLIREAFRRMGMKVDIAMVPWARLMKMLEYGTIDAAFPLLKNEKRLNYIDFTEPFTYEETGLFVKKSTKIVWTGDMSDLSDYSFGRVRGYSSGEMVDSFINKGVIKIDEATSTQQNIKKLLAGRVDIILETRHVVLMELRKHEELSDVELLAVASTTPAYLGFSKKLNHQDVIGKFNAALQTMKEDGTYDKIVNEFEITE